MFSSIVPAPGVLGSSLAPDAALLDFAKANGLTPPLPGCWCSSCDAARANILGRMPPPSSSPEGGA